MAAVGLTASLGACAKPARDTYKLNNGYETTCHAIRTGEIALNQDAHCSPGTPDDKKIKIPGFPEMGIREALYQFLSCAFLIPDVSFLEPDSTISENTNNIYLGGEGGMDKDGFLLQGQSPEDPGNQRHQDKLFVFTSWRGGRIIPIIIRIRILSHEIGHSLGLDHNFSPDMSIMSDACERGDEACPPWRITRDEATLLIQYARNDHLAKTEKDQIINDLMTIMSRCSRQINVVIALGK